MKTNGTRHHSALVIYLGFSPCIGCRFDAEKVSMCAGHKGPEMRHFRVLYLLG